MTASGRRSRSLARARARSASLPRVALTLRTGPIISTSSPAARAEASAVIPALTFASVTDSPALILHHPHESA